MQLVFRTVLPTINLHLKAYGEKASLGSLLLRYDSNVCIEHFVYVAR